MKPKNRIQSINKKTKPWKLEPLIIELHKSMKFAVHNWLDKYFEREAPEKVVAYLKARDPRGVDWVAEQGYHHDHRRIRHINETSFAMEFDLYKGEEIVNTLSFIVEHDGKVAEPHTVAAMIFTGQLTSDFH